MNRGGSFDEIRKRVTGILSKQREPMERISRELIRKETLERAELDSLLAVGDPEKVAIRWGLREGASSRGVIRLRLRRRVFPAIVRA